MFNQGCISDDSSQAGPRTRLPAGRKRRGVSLIEVLIVMMMIGTITAFALPKVRTAQQHESTRNARREVQTLLARAKGTAVQRGCRGTLHFRQADDKIWVTTCRMVVAGGNTLDTLGGIVHLNARYGVDMTSNADSIPFAPNSLGLATSMITMGFTKGGYTSSLQITPVGRPIW